MTKSFAPETQVCGISAGWQDRKFQFSETMLRPLMFHKFFHFNKACLWCRAHFRLKQICFLLLRVSGENPIRKSCIGYRFDNSFFRNSHTAILSNNDGSRQSSFQKQLKTKVRFPDWACVFSNAWSRWFLPFRRFLKVVPSWLCRCLGFVTTFTKSLWLGRNTEVPLATETAVHKNVRDKQKHKNTS